MFIFIYTKEGDNGEVSLTSVKIAQTIRMHRPFNLLLLLLNLKDFYFISNEKTKQNVGELACLVFGYNFIGKNK